MKTLSTATSKTMALATELTSINLKEAKALMHDLKVKGGYQATARDLFQLVSGGRNGLYEKLVFKLESGPITAFAVQKTGMIYIITMEKSNMVELSTQRATTLINLIEGYQPTEEEIRLDTFKGKCLISLREALDRAETFRGKNAKVSDVLHFLVPGLEMKSGRYAFQTPQFRIKFLTMLGHTIVEVEDANGFSRRMNMAKNLRELVGY